MTVRYSVLLPTRNGAALLEPCIRSVLREDRDDIELVVSNNASLDGTREILAGIDDERLRVLELEAPVPVTDNWNHALRRSTGDRVLLLGDDDLMLPGYFDRADALVERFDDPDVLLYNAYAYAFPGFMGSADSHYADPFYEVDAAIVQDALLDVAQRRAIVASMFRFRFPLHLNMQTALVHRRAVEALHGGIFKPPFPDFYGLNALMLRCASWALSSERLVVVGISPKSFGRTVNSATSQHEGSTYLGIENDFPGQLPGSEIVNGTYETLLALREDYLDELAGIEIDRAEYVTQQVYSWYVQRRLGSLRTGEVLRRLRMLGARDWRLLGGLLAKRIRPAALRRRLSIDRSDPAVQLWPGMRPIPEVADIVEFAEWVTTRRMDGSG